MGPAGHSECFTVKTLPVNIKKRPCTAKRHGRVPSSTDTVKVHKCLFKRGMSVKSDGNERHGG